MLPDFFPLDEQKKETLNHQAYLSVKRIDMVKQYSWENDKSEESEAQTIAESWMMYFGLEASDSWCSFRDYDIVCYYAWKKFVRERMYIVLLNIRAVHGFL